MAAALESSIARLKLSLITHIDRRVVLSARQGGKGDGLQAAAEVATFLRGRYGGQNVMVVVPNEIFTSTGSQEGSVKWECGCEELWPSDASAVGGQPSLPPPLKALVKSVDDMCDWLRKDDKHMVALWEPSMPCACALMVKVRSSPFHTAQEPAPRPQITTTAPCSHRTHADPSCCTPHNPVATHDIKPHTRPTKRHHTHKNHTAHV
jgi:hypothetical protein